MYEAIVIGTSAGGMQALQEVLAALPKNFALPIMIVQHVASHSESYWIEHIGKSCAIVVKEAEDKERLRGGTAYLAPPGYHLLVEQDHTLSLSVDVRVNYCCPSVDVLFESAAEVFGEGLIGVVLTGANADGSNGIKAIKSNGGISVVQNPSTAEFPYMPKSALEIVPPDYIVDLDKMPALFELLSQSRNRWRRSDGTR